MVEFEVQNQVVFPDLVGLILRGWWLAFLVEVL